MTIKVFEFECRWSEIPATIFANDPHEAEQIFREWAALHYPQQCGEPAVIYPFAESRLEARPLLDAAAALDVAGIGYWDSDRCAWVIASASEDAIGERSPPERRVGYYRVEDEGGDTKMVFAKSLEEVTAHYCAWHVDAWGELPTYFSIDKRSHWELLGQLATLRDGLEAEITGVAKWDNDGVWRILPPDWEPIYGRE